MPRREGHRVPRRSLALPHIGLRDCGNSCRTMNVTSVAVIFDDDDGSLDHETSVVFDADRCN